MQLFKYSLRPFPCGPFIIHPWTDTNMLHKFNIQTQSTHK